MNEPIKYPIQSLAFAPTTSAPQQLDFQAGTVTLWSAAFNGDSLHLQLLQETLSGDERARAQRFRFQPDRHQFIYARGTLRTLLAQSLNVTPTALRFGYENNGKPYLITDTGTRSPLQFNVSHTKGLVMYAMAWNCELGLDVEQVRAELAEDATAQQFLTASELNAWRGLSATFQPTAFFHLWTCKEAYLKTLGTGLSIAPETIALTLNDEALPQWIEIPPSQASWAFYYFVPQPGYVGALGLKW